MSKRNIDEQLDLAVGVITAVVRGEELSIEEGEVECLRQFVKTARWLKANHDAIRLAVMILKDDAVKSVQEAFPDAKIVRASKIDDRQMENTDGD
jgi:hypothetical protein